jgi:AAA15 family ATPase/GTPase
MRLLYLRLFKTQHDRDLSFYDRDINFDGRISFHWNSEKKSIEYVKNESYYSELYGPEINITGIIGKNGSGKTSFLKIIRFLVADLNGFVEQPGLRNRQYNWVAVIQEKSMVYSVSTSNNPEHSDDTIAWLPPFSRKEIKKLKGFFDSTYYVGYPFIIPLTLNWKNLGMIGLIMLM